MHYLEIMSDKKKSILDASVSLFAQKGYRSTTIRMIAGKAEVNVALISYYFGSKHNLLSAMLERYMSEVKNLLQRIIEVESRPELVIRKFFLDYADFAFENPGTVIVAHREMTLLNEHPGMVKELAMNMVDLHKALKEILKEAINSQSDCNIDIELSVLTLNATIESFLVNAFMFNRDCPFLDIAPATRSQMKERMKNHLSVLLERMISG